MSFTSTEEALLRELIDQQAAILSLAENESTITSKLSATKATLSDLDAASSLADTDLLLVRQGTEDKSVSATILQDYSTPASASTTVQGIVELATNTETITGTDTARAVTPAGLAAKTASETAQGLVELATSAETITGTDTARAVTPAGLSSALSNVIMRGLFKKDSPRTRLFNPATSTTLSTTSKLWVEVNGTMQSFIAGTSVVMPSLTAGSDYAIYACTDGTLRADSNFSAPTGYTTLTSRFIGSAHYAPGGNATAQSGGNTTPAFNPYSCFDLTYRPSRTDWRGMTTDPGLSVCGMIYLLNTDPAANGASKYNVTMADGSSPPKIPTQFGGNGSTSYSSFNWWEAREILAANGMRLPSYGEFSALTYGTTEASSIGTDQVSTILNAAYTSKCGIIQATGVLWIWGDEFGGGAAAAGWTANTGGRGYTYQMENAVIFGGNWYDGASSGSRCSFWSNSPTYSGNNIGARGVCDLLILD